MNRNEIIAWFVMIVPPVTAFAIMWLFIGFWHALLAQGLFTLGIIAMVAGMRVYASKDDDWWL